MAKEPASIFTLNYTPLQVYWVKDTCPITKKNSVVTTNMHVNILS